MGGIQRRAAALATLFFLGVSFGGLGGTDAAAAGPRLTVRQGIAAFGPAGYLPPGLHVTDFGSFNERYATSPRRELLLRHLRSALLEIHEAGFNRVYVGGSFVSAKDNPGDIDLLVPRQAGDWAKLVTVARREQGRLHFFGARKIVTDVLSTEIKITEAQRRAWEVRKPDFVEFFSQNRSGDEVGLVAIDLKKDLAAVSIR